MKGAKSKRGAKEGAAVQVPRWTRKGGMFRRCSRDAETRGCGASLSVSITLSRLIYSLSVQFDYLISVRMPGRTIVGAMQNIH